MKSAAPQADTRSALVHECDGTRFVPMAPVIGRSGRTHKPGLVTQQLTDLRPPGELQLGEDRVHVVLHRRNAQVQFGRDLLVRIALFEEADGLGLAPRQQLGSRQDLARLAPAAESSTSDLVTLGSQVVSPRSAMPSTPTSSSSVASRGTQATSPASAYAITSFATGDVVSATTGTSTS